MKKFILYLYNHTKICKKLIYFLCIRTKGEFRSKILRYIYEKNKNISAGYLSYGWSQNSLDGPIIIGNYVSISSPVRRIAFNHHMGISTHPFYFNPKLKIVTEDFRKKSTLIIGNDVWIGANVTILPNVVKIGDGVIIGAGSVVTKNIPDYAIVAGNPAKIIKYRFNDDQIKVIKESKWWDWDKSFIEKNARSFDSFENFIKLLEID